MPRPNRLELIDRFEGEFGFLSNFYPSRSMRWKAYGKEWHPPTAEHVFQASKATNEKDFTMIMGAKTPKLAKALGNGLREIHPKWDKKRMVVMHLIIQRKFRKGSAMGIMLQNTAPAELVEGNDWHDTFWGVCYCARHRGEGQNMLGKLLMRHREAITT